MTDLVKTLDDAAAKLLDQVGLGPVTPEKIEATPTERVKAFDSVLEYAKLRPALAPKEEKDSAFDRIKREFDGEKVERRGRPRKTAPAADPGIVVNGAAEPVVQSDSLFDA